MDKKKKTCLVAGLYMLLALVCLAVLLWIGHMTAGPPHRGELEQESSQGPEDETREEIGDTETSEESGAGSGPAKEPDTGEGSVPMPEDRNKEKQDEIGQMEPETVPEPEVKLPPKVVFASDLHYYPSELTDYGEAFQRMVAKDDGKAVPYITSLMEAFFDEVILEQPTALVLTGDLTLNGERAGHERLAERLRRVEEAGIKVLVIPGNHDINNPHAASYFGEEREEAQQVDAGEFYQIYRTYGYDQAVSRDPASLSYVYQLDDRNWLMLLDSCQYEPYNLVGGRIREDTLAWMEDMLRKAEDAGIAVLPVAHHNLLKESILYPTDCTLENSARVTELLEDYRVPLYISGHLHLQRTKKYRMEPGEPEDVYHISEIVSDSVAIPPCRYGVLAWGGDGSLTYQTRNLDVETWARGGGLEEEALLNFSEYGDTFLYEVISEQIYQKMNSLPEEQMRAMAGLYAELNSAYCRGQAVDAKEVKSSAAYRLWERNLPDSRMFEDLNTILKDTGGDHNEWSYLPPREEAAGEAGAEAAAGEAVAGAETAAAESKSVGGAAGPGAEPEGGCNKRVKRVWGENRCILR